MDVRQTPAREHYAVRPEAFGAAGSGFLRPWLSPIRICGLRQLLGSFNYLRISPSVYCSGFERKVKTMKNKLTKPRFKPVLGIAGQLFIRVACLGVVILICPNASAQNLFVSGGNSIYEFTPTGVETTFPSGLTGPGALAFDGAGNLFVADTDAGGIGSIYEFSPFGVRTTFATGLNYPSGLAFDMAGNLFVAEATAISKFTPAGVRTIFASGLNASVGLALDSAGNLFVTDWGTGSGGYVYKFTPFGVRTTFASGFISPEGLAVDSAGNLFVLEGGDIDGLGAAIYKFTPTGHRHTFASPFQCIGPGLAIDSADNVFVPDWCTGDIHKFTSHAKESTFVSGSNHATGSFLACQ
jgi:sugar lactone lactonase YvrE